MCWDVMAVVVYVAKVKVGKRGMCWQWWRGGVPQQSS